MRSSAVITLILLLSAGCALSGGTPNNPFHQVQPAPVPTPIPQPPTVTHRIPDLGAWLDASSQTKDFTTFVTVYLDCDDPNPPFIPSDGRKILWFTGGLLTYGPTARSRGGYALRSDAAKCWESERAIIESHASRSLGIHLVDEPESVAYGDRPASGYDPNLYNDAIGILARMVHADFPTVPISLNYGSIPPGLVVPPGIDRVALEAYGVDWLAKLRALELITDKPIWLMPPAFVDGDPTVADPILAQRVKDQYAYAQTDPRVTGLYYFLQCCDDTTTGDKSFFTVGGGHLPLALDALKAVGKEVLAGGP